MNQKDIEEFVAKLSAEQVTDVTNSVLRMERRRCKTLAISLASALEANLKFIGMKLAAGQVRSIVDQISDHEV